MGHTHAALILLTMNWRIIDRALASSRRFRDCKILNRACDRATRLLLAGDHAALYVHLDDCGIFAATVEAARALRAELIDAFTNVGFIMTAESPMPGGRYIGFEPIQSPAGWAPELLKLGLLDLSLEELARAPVILVEALHTALAVYVWFGLLWRPALSAPQDVFRVVQFHHGGMARMTSTIKQEL